MSLNYFTLKLENSDIAFDNNGRLKTTEDIGQNYKVLLETEYESDYRDPSYGFKWMELIEDDYSDTESIIRLFFIEALQQHPRTKEILEVNIEKVADREWSASAKITLKPTNEIINIEGLQVNV